MLAKLRENPAHLQQFLQKRAKAPPNPAYLQDLGGARPLRQAGAQRQRLRPAPMLRPARKPAPSADAELGAKSASSAQASAQRASRRPAPMLRPARKSALSA
ncbi:hypothetical protein EBB07_16835 [Paenibacillaceae bacterium]|nr:hypothetical protein EBB07_16835 [Paenibacillaceae bacterium]